MAVIGLPVENLLSMRTVGQTLAQRAQCRLLSGQPSEALKELTLLHDLCRILDGPPTNRHTTPNTAVIDAELAGMHANVVADGLRLNAWQEPQLAALQTQLEEVDLRPSLARAFADGPAFTCSAIEKVIVAQRSHLYLFGSSSLSLLQRLKYARYLLYDMVPRGWFYHGLVDLAELLKHINDVSDISGRLVIPQKVEKARHDVQATATHFLVGAALATFAVPDVVYAHRTVAFTQTTVNQAALACALERYRLVRGRYPDSIEALAPEFVRVNPMDIIGGRPLHYSRIPDQGYQIYSVGWDEKDDNGIPSSIGAAGPDLASGDWTWRFPVD